MDAHAKAALHSKSYLEDWPEARTSLVAQLTLPQASMRVPQELIEALAGETELVPVTWPSPLTGLVWQAVLNRPTYLEMVSTSLVKHWKVPDEAVQEVALRNTRERLPEWVESTTADGRKFYLCHGENRFEGGAAALPEQWAKLPIPPDRLWVGSPMRDCAIAFEAGEPDSEDKAFLWSVALTALCFWRQSKRANLPTIYGPRAHGWYRISALPV